MDIKIQDLLKSELLSEVALQAGEAGRSKVISSVAVLESITGIDLLKKDELVLTTAYYVKDDEKLQREFVEKLSSKGLAGMGILLKLFDDKLPQAIRDTADRLGFPIIVLPEGTAYSEIIEYIGTYSSYRLQRIFKYINNSIFQDGVQSVADVLREYTGLQVIIEFGDRKYRSPSEYQTPEYLLDERHWYLKEGTGGSSTDVEVYGREIKGLRYEWMSVDIKADGVKQGRIIATKGEKEFSSDDEKLLDYAASVCALEFNFIKSLIDIQRKHKKDFLEAIFNGYFNRIEAQKQAEKLNYRIPDYGIVIVIRSECRADELLEDEIESYVNKLFGNDVIQGMIDVNDYLILMDDSEENVGLVDKLGSYINADMKTGDALMGIGRPTVFDNIPRSYHEANAALQIGSSCDLGTKIFEFNNLGFYRLLLSNELDKEIARFYKDYLQPLEIYDQQHGSELMDTLKCLIKMDYKHSEAAEEMFVHQNTLRYRLKTVERLCRINLDLPENKFLMEVAVKLIPLIKCDTNKL